MGSNPTPPAKIMELSDFRDVHDLLTRAESLTSAYLDDAENNPYTRYTSEINSDLDSVALLLDDAEERLEIIALEGFSDTQLEEIYNTLQRAIWHCGKGLEYLRGRVLDAC